MKWFQTFIFLIIMIPAFGQTQIRTKISQIADSIAAYNQYNSAGVSYAGIRTAQWDHFISLKKKHQIKN